MFKDRTTRERVTHEKIDELYADPVQADPGAYYAKQLYLNLSTLSPYVSGPNSVKVSTPLSELAPKRIKVDRAYIVSCTNSRASDIAAAAKVFQDAAKANGGGSLKSQRVSSCISRRLRLVSRRSLKMKVAGRLCLRLGVSHSRPPVDLVSPWHRSFGGRRGWNLCFEPELPGGWALERSGVPCQS